jgi:CheY-like chemotaxis protein
VSVCGLLLLLGLLLSEQELVVCRIEPCPLSLHLVDSGDRALLHLTAHRTDLVLLDISMPGMNALDVCQRIRADHGLRGLRVIAYTTHAFLEEQQRFLAGGFDDVLVKPISFRAVQEMLLAQPSCP